MLMMFTHALPKSDLKILQPTKYFPKVSEKQREPQHSEIYQILNQRDGTPREILTCSRRVKSMVFNLNVLRDGGDSNTSKRYQNIFQYE